MSIAEERAVVLKAVERWGASDLEGLLACATDDVVHVVNVDGTQVPYAASVEGKDNLRERLQLLLDTLEVQAFVPESIAHDAECTRLSVLGFYKHHRTGERLDIKVRFVCFVRDGLIHRFEEYHDAAYVEAFQRFVSYLEAAARERDHPQPKD